MARPKRTTIAGSSVNVVKATPSESTTWRGDSADGVARLKFEKLRFFFFFLNFIIFFNFTVRAISLFSDGLALRFILNNKIVNNM
jgi:hypothetical protein